MPLKSSITLATPLVETGVVSARQGELLATLGLTNVGKLIAHLPLRHERIEAESTIAELVAGSIVSARGTVDRVRPVRGARPRLEAVVNDHTGRLDVVWFNGLYLHDKVTPGARVRLLGKVQKRGPQTQMVNPKVEVLDAAREEPSERESRVRPVYPANEWINSAGIERVMAKVLPGALPLLEDHLPESFRAERDLPSLRECYRMQHAPANDEEPPQSRRRLAYDELLLLQLGVQIKRVHLRSALRSPALDVSSAVQQRIRARFPHTLTQGQEEAVADLVRDLAGTTPTNRLLQGDVGSGKTLVALYAMLLAVASKHQASLMAPTEVLAEQHMSAIERVLAGSRVRTALLTGATPPTQRARTLRELEAGEVDILIGTHALLGEGVSFRSLAVAVIDEQHKFGVSQRATLRAQATDERLTPHVIVMTATPIPRSLALTLFGDLDTSTISGLPPGRTPITTHVLSSTKRRAAYDELEARIRQGQQGFVVAPAVEPSQLDANTPLVDVGTLAEAMRTTLLPGRRVEVLHAQLPREQRERVMQSFRDGKIDALVATTVIEVGVDVPNATLMIVEQADRFGLAQLHQLRGRVGRSSTASACYLIADPVTPDGAARLSVMASTSDGFELAEKDLEIRGMGEVFGVRQSGLPPFRVADPTRDRDLLNLARRDAKQWIAQSPALDRPEEALLRARLWKTHGQFLGLGDVG